MNQTLSYSFEAQTFGLEDDVFMACKKQDIGIKFLKMKVAS